jgi:hypothetical protein
LNRSKAEQFPPERWQIHLHSHSFFWFHLSLLYLSWALNYWAA